MVTTIRALVTTANLPDDVLAPAKFSLNGAELGHYFAEAVQPFDFALSLVSSTTPHPFPKSIGAPTSLPMLQDVLAAVLAKETDPLTIGVILCNAYDKLPDALGLMFDTDLGQIQKIGPRRGLALFLSTMTVQAGALLNDQQTADYIGYTLIHELGHVFNLWHLERSSTFMNPDIVGGQLNALTFDDTHKQFLRLLDGGSQAHYVLPGGSRFGDRPPPFSQDDSVAAAVAGEDHPNALLEIALTHDRFIPFEPVSLDVRVTARPGRGKVNLREEFDPGHQTFEIWITRPDGRHCRYQPFVHYCQPGRPLVVEEKVPFTCRVPIWRQPGRWSFDQPGRFAIQVVLRVGEGEVLRSNIAHGEVVRRNAWGSWKRGNRAIRSPITQRALFHDAAWPASKHADRLLRLAEARPSEQTSAAILQTARRGGWDLKSGISSVLSHADTSRPEPTITQQIQTNKAGDFR